LESLWIFSVDSTASSQLRFGSSLFFQACCSKTALPAKSQASTLKEGGALNPLLWHLWHVIAIDKKLSEPCQTLRLNGIQREFGSGFVAH